MAGTHIPKRSLIESLSLPLTIPRYGQHTTLKAVLKSTSANVDLGLEARVGRVAVGVIPHGRGKQVTLPPPAPLKTARRGFAVSAFVFAASRCLGFAVSAFVCGF